MSPYDQARFILLGAVSAWIALTFTAIILLNYFHNNDGKGEGDG